ncbi:NAD(P)-dependent oxidoreductase [Azospirillum halopraeferens]|uniref:NAD(P)-dependent oxidoreductase n=1 Tax=Azospirillum halopraeferens TaxID=34010 RepID=UPI0004007379|nr:NAD(P)-dependent oxidoreductase [Azospirillum halopraeferens]
MDPTAQSPIGFIGLGVMGEAMCRNLARKSGRTVIGFDRSPAPLERLDAHGVRTAGGPDEVAERCAVVFLCLPSGVHVDAVCRGPDGLLACMRPGATVVDFGTSPVGLTRELAAAFAAKGVRYADAPIARTRQAAETGTLSITVGADAETFEAVRPLLACCGSDITHCGPVGNGQIVKILNNMVLIETVVALSEALAVARRSGLDGAVLFEALSKGSADSFALRNHGMKAVLPGTFPEQAFSTAYALKDLGYALNLADEAGLPLDGARLAERLLERAAEQGYRDLYWPVVSRVIGTAG